MHRASKQIHSFLLQLDNIIRIRQYFAIVVIVLYSIILYIIYYIVDVIYYRQKLDTKSSVFRFISQ